MTFLIRILILLIYSIKKCLNNSKRYISLPFTIQQEKIYPSEQYNFEIFILNNFYKNITYTFYIGNPPVKVDGIILNDNSCFELKLLNDISITKDYIKTTKNKYFPKDSSSFSLSHKELRWNKGHYMTIGSDLFNIEKEKFFNLSFLLNKSEVDKVNSREIENREYIIKFNLKVQSSFTGDECPNFMYYIRAKAALSKYSISYIFKNSEEGSLIIGNELYNFNEKVYNESHFTGVYTFNYNSLNHDEEIIVDSFNNCNITLNKTDAYIEYNYGIILGTNQYKKFLDDIFFNDLISDNICKIEIVKLNENSEYYIYICRDNLKLANFPKLIFFSRSYKYNFELNYKDLFIKKFDNNFYFLVLFRVNKDIKDDWILGEPFYKKYTFSFNLDAKIVGFYDKIFFNENTTEEKIDLDNEDNNSGYTGFMILLILIGLIVLILLMLLSFYYGMKLKEGRKKRANELKEDNYEYFPESDKENNKLTTNIN